MKYSGWQLGVAATGTHVPYGIAHCVTCHPTDVAFPPLALYTLLMSVLLLVTSIAIIRPHHMHIVQRCGLVICLSVGHNCQPYNS